MEKETFTLAELSDILYLFGNDIHMLHFHTNGKGFLSNHTILEDLYTIAFNGYDLLAELAISQGEPIDSASTIMSRCDYWTPLTLNDTFDYENTVKETIERGQLVLECLKGVMDYDSFIGSEIDEIIFEIEKIVNYKFKQIEKGL